MRDKGEHSFPQTFAPLLMKGANAWPIIVVADVEPRLLVFNPRRAALVIAFPDQLRTKRFFDGLTMRNETIEGGLVVRCSLHPDGEQDFCARNGGDIMKLITSNPGSACHEMRVIGKQNLFLLNIFVISNLKLYLKLM